MAEDASIESIHRNYEAIAAGANSSDSEEISASRRPTLTEESAASGSTYISDDALTRSTTATSKREPVFMPVRPGDTAELTRIATVIGRTKSAASAGHHEEGAELERKDTLYNVQLGDPVLDPTSTEFDVYKWAKM
jgi:ATP-binding cassette subfamily G (WHITE) protein 2 (PDR)